MNPTPDVIVTNRVIRGLVVSIKLCKGVTGRISIAVIPNLGVLTASAELVVEIRAD